MRRRRLIPTASLVAVIAAGWFIATDRAPAAERHISGVQVVSSDVSANLLSLGINKAVVINLPADIRDVLVADPKIASAVVRSKRRVFIIGGAKDGQTNMYFFDADGRQIGGLDIAVTSDPRPLNVLADPVVVRNVIVVYRGMNSTTYSCTPSCNNPRTADGAPLEQPATTQIIHSVNENININK
jgi:Flp pilus assembly secretin CpaC